MSEENITQQDTPEAESTPKEVSIPELDAFIFDRDEFTDFIVPRKLLPSEVAQFLIQKIEEDTKLEAFEQVEKVAKFYDTFEVAEKFKKFLKKSESNSDETIRSIVITRIIAVLGDKTDRSLAKQYYEYLIQKVDSIREFEELILLHENLGLGKNSAALRNRIDAKIKSLESSKGSDYQAQVTSVKLQQSIKLKLQQAEEVQAIKDKILATSDRKQRLVEEIKLYLFNDYGVPDIFDPWSSRRLRQETWAKQPGEQNERVDDQPLKKDVTVALRDFLTDLDTHKGLQRQARDAAKLRILRAIKFFDGQVKEEEEVFINGFDGQQIDILANTGYLLKNK